MTQREAAAVFGVPVSHLSRIENGHLDPRPALAAAAMVRTYRLFPPRPTDEPRSAADTTAPRGARPSAQGGQQPTEALLPSAGGAPRRRAGWGPARRTRILTRPTSSSNVP